MKYPPCSRNFTGVELKHAEVTKTLIGVFYEVYRKLGYGFLERVYGNAMTLGAGKLGLEIVREYPIRIHYEGSVIGEYQADLVVNNAVIAELKACRGIAPEHEAQLLNYLKASRFEVGLLFNFGPEPQYRRMVYDNSRKGGLAWIK